MISFKKIRSVVPSDAADLPVNDGVCSAVMCTVAGDLRVTTEAGNIIAIPIAANQMYFLRIAKVWATGTTATGIFAFYQPVKLFNIDR